MPHSLQVSDRRPTLGCGRGVHFGDEYVAAADRCFYYVFVPYDMGKERPRIRDGVRPTQSLNPYPMPIPWR